jgi:hypothetical protein
VHAAGVDALCTQQLWPVFPHSQWPALQAPVLPTHIWPSPMQTFCQQQLEPSQRLPSQQGWPGPPQAWQVRPLGPPAHTAPALQVSGW